ncbi:hypothetical protein BH09PSE5_BH09PSE5_13480 [soil metagenome]
MNTQTQTSPVPRPWYTYSHVWLVISGPAAVVVAGFVTLYIAIRQPDPVVSQDYYRLGLEINRTLHEPLKSVTPAEQGRNHAATPAKDQPQPRLATEPAP